MTNEKKEEQQNDQESKRASEPNVTEENYSQWGYDLYPERRGKNTDDSWYRILSGAYGREKKDKLNCEKNLYYCMQNSPVVNLMMSALKTSGCEIDIRRHFSCEICDNRVSGGYDPELNQVVVCQNTARTSNLVQGVLVHEMIHMFDFCRNELDFKNIDHLACTEVRAANLTHCSFINAWWQGTASPFNVRGTHKECVKTKAVSSVMTARNVTEEEARAAVNRVFSKCYDDLEPIGRRVRRNSFDMHKAVLEAPLYGYGT